VKKKLAEYFRFIATLNLQKIFNASIIYLSYFISKIFRTPIYWGNPISASIEITTQCNLKCPECPSGLRKFSRPTGSIDIIAFQKYLQALEKHLTYLLLYFQGEPYMNKDFFKIISRAKKKNIYTATSTNAHFLSEENASATVASRLDRLIISLDGTNSETYSQYRIGGNFDKVVNGIKNLVQAKKEAKSSTPYIIIQFLVLQSNEHQIDDIQRMTKELGVDELQLKTAQFYDYKNGNPLMPLNARYSRYKKNNDGSFSLKKKSKNQCLRMWQSLVITWDGKVVPCCFDKDAKHILGDLNQSDFTEIIKGKDYQAFRKTILKNRNAIDICNNCSE
jgi:radical SAM protein with 4Fe4S-binding SPASM domain